MREELQFLRSAKGKCYSIIQWKRLLIIYEVCCYNYNFCLGNRVTSSKDFLLHVQHLMTIANLNGLSNEEIELILEVLFGMPIGMYFSLKKKVV